MSYSAMGQLMDMGEFSHESKIHASSAVWLVSTNYRLSALRSNSINNKHTKDDVKRTKPKAQTLFPV